MSVNIAPQTRLQYLDGNGDPYAGAKLFTYLNGTITKQATYTTAMQDVAHTNPIILDSSGRPPAEVWLVAGSSYTFVLAPSTDTDPPTSPILTDNDITGVNDVSISSTLTQWIDGTTPTYINGTSFSLAGNQTTIFEPGRRVKLTLASTILYATIATSVFTTVTTINVITDTGASLDNTLSAVSYSALSVSGPSIPELLINQQIPGIVNGYVSWVFSAGALTARILTSTSTNPYLGDPVYIKFRNSSGTSGNLITKAVTAATTTVTASAGSTLGTVSGKASRIYCLAIDTGSGIVLGLYNPLNAPTDASTSIIAINDSALHSSAAEGGAGAADNAQTIYSTAAQSAKPVAVLGWFESTQTTAGTWAQAATAVHTLTIGSHKTGDIVQRKFNLITGISSAVATIPADDTIPQISEGVEFYTSAITMQSTANLLSAKTDFILSLDTAAKSATMAMFVNSQANALAATVKYFDVVTSIFNLGLHWVGRPLASINTISIRLGGESSLTITLNGAAGVRIFGGVAGSYLLLEEIWV